MNLQPVLFSTNLHKNNFKFGTHNPSEDPGKRINLPRGITLTICNITGDKVTLGIEAPKETPVSKVEKPTEPPSAQQPKNRFPFPPASNN